MQIEKPKSSPIKPIIIALVAIVVVIGGLKLVQNASQKSSGLEALDISLEDGVNSADLLLTSDELTESEFDELEVIEDESQDAPEAMESDVSQKAQEYRKVKLEPLKAAGEFAPQPVADATESLETSLDEMAQAAKNIMSDVSEDVTKKAATEESVEKIAAPEREVLIEQAPNRSFVSSLLPNLKSIFVRDSPFTLDGFYGDVSVVKGRDGREIPAQKGQKLFENDIVKVGDKSEANLSINGKYLMRLKPNSQMKHLTPRVAEKYAGKRDVIYRLDLLEGTVLGVTDGGQDASQKVALFSQDKRLEVHGATYRLSEDVDSTMNLGVLRGLVKLGFADESKSEAIFVRGLEGASYKPDSLLGGVKKVSEKEWEQLQEAYELMERDSSQEADQVEISKSAGGLFNYVFDHGTFFTPRVGFARRNFFREESSGQVRLEIEYDVFPDESYVGIYFLTRGLDAHKYGGFKFEARHVVDEAYPDNFTIEVKSKYETLHAFKVTGLKLDWQPYEFVFYQDKSTPLSELTLVFHNSEVGGNKKGIVEMRNFELLPVSEELARLAEIKKIQAEKVNTMEQRAVVVSSQKIEASDAGKKKLSGAEMQENYKAVRKAEEERKIANTVAKVVSLSDL